MHLCEQQLAPFIERGKAGRAGHLPYPLSRALILASSALERLVISLIAPGDIGINRDIAVLLGEGVSIPLRLSSRSFAGIGTQKG